MGVALILIRRFAVVLFVLGQTAAAFAGQSLAAGERSGEKIVICTPSGLKVIVWDGEEELPAEAAGPLCPLCVMAAALPPPACSASPSAIARYEPYAPPAALFLVPIASASPYPARAPPL